MSYVILITTYLTSFLQITSLRAPQTRGHIKTIAKALVESLYGLNVEKGKCMNRNKVEDLLERFGFVHKVGSVSSLA